MEAIDAIYVLLRLGLPFVFAILGLVVLWQLWKKHLVKPQLIVMGVIVVVWFGLAPVHRWFWKRDLTADLFGQAFAPRLVDEYSVVYDWFLGDGTDYYVFEIPAKRLASLTNAAALNASGLPKSRAGSDGWTMIRWQHAPYSNDNHQVQYLALSSCLPAPSGISGSQFEEMMKKPATLFACEYKYLPSSDSTPHSEDAYIVSFYILDSVTRRLICIFAKT